jgi:hypothetical protein
MRLPKFTKFSKIYHAKRNLFIMLRDFQNSIGFLEISSTLLFSSSLNLKGGIRKKALYYSLTSSHQ